MGLKRVDASEKVAERIRIHKIEVLLAAAGIEFDEEYLDTIVEPY